MNRSITVNADGTIAVEMSGTFTPDEIREAVQQLCQARAQVAQDAPDPAGQPVMLVDDAAWAAVPYNERSTLVLRVPGLGWVGTVLTRADSLKLSHFLVGHQHNVLAATAPANTTSLTQDVSGGGTSGALH